MAGTIGKITNSVYSFQNENSAALATLNFDFTLVKLDAPAEYRGLGEAISRNRRLDAEDGALHQTARKLDALFGELLPATDALLRAYGTRVSEIASMIAVNPRGSSDTAGFFASHMGADTTSIWAAVTSGSAAIAIHLLACMLARTFTGPEAISVWVELVQKQKETVLNKQQSGLYAHEHRASVLAAQQVISRTDLANWDASARAWLQSADQAKAFQHKQVMLILNNAGVPVNSEPDTYGSVTKAWITALEAMENLVNGMPQRVQDGAALLAISSWHLYPDLVVYGGSCVEVRQGDQIFPKSALLTLGLEDVREDNKSVYWSLPLACLQYYGDPVTASRGVGRENSRVSYEEFAYIVLGCLFDGWGDFATTNEIGMQWLMKLLRIINSEKDVRSASTLQANRWMTFLLSAAERFSGCDSSERKIAQQLMNLGRRRSSFLQQQSDVPKPLLGLSQVDQIIPVLKNEEEKIAFLRKLAVHLKIFRQGYLIRYRFTSDNPQRGMREFAYASISPFSKTTLKRTSDGEMKQCNEEIPKNVQWLAMTDGDLITYIRCYQDLQCIPSAVEKLSRLEHLQVQDTVITIQSISQDGHNGAERVDDTQRKQRKTEIYDLQKMIPIARRILTIEKVGELCLPVGIGRLDVDDLIFSAKSNFLDAAKDILEKLGSRQCLPIQCGFFVGESSTAALYRVPVDNPTHLYYPYGFESRTMAPDFLEDVFATLNFSIDQIETWFSFDTKIRDQIESLRICATISEIYEELQGASISTLVLTRSLSHVKWYPRHQAHINSQTLHLAQIFGCIAMFESGTCELEPGSLKEVFAMSSGNSLYIAELLLHDPYRHLAQSQLQPQVRRVTGNIGRAGITFLISPPEVKTREADLEKWTTINHIPFDGVLEDHFATTSIHLSFTLYEIPLVTDSRQHLIDRAVTLVETLVSVYDGGTWVAEIDILKASRYTALHIPHGDADHVFHLENGFPERHLCTKDNKYLTALARHPFPAAASVENWDELIQPPPGGGIAFRAHKNWLARLAGVAVCGRLGFYPIILPEQPCWECCMQLIARDQYSLRKGRYAIIC